MLNCPATGDAGVPVVSSVPGWFIALFEYRSTTRLVAVDPASTNTRRLVTGPVALLTVLNAPATPAVRVGVGRDGRVAEHERRRCRRSCARARERDAMRAPGGVVGDLQRCAAGSGNRRGERDFPGARAPRCDRSREAGAGRD